MNGSEQNPDQSSDKPDEVPAEQNDKEEKVRRKGRGGAKRAGARMGELIAGATITGMAKVAIEKAIDALGGN